MEILIFKKGWVGQPHFKCARTTRAFISKSIFTSSEPFLRVLSHMAISKSNSIRRKARDLCECTNYWKGFSSRIISDFLFSAWRRMDKFISTAIRVTHMYRI